MYFTIKFYPYGGASELRNCYQAHTYAVRPAEEDGTIGVELHGAGNVSGMIEVFVRPGQSIFIENANGKTVEAIRVDKK